VSGDDRPDVESDGGTVAAPSASASSRSVDEVLRGIEYRQWLARGLLVAGLVALAGLTWVGMGFLGVKPDDLARQFPTFVESLQAFLTPDFVDFTTYSRENELTGWSGLVESLLNPSSLLTSLGSQEGIVGVSVVTVVIGFTGTVLGFPLALLLGVLGSERVTPFPFNFLFRGLMSTIRAVPALVWILIYIPLAGISPVSAMLAVATDTVGNLGRLFTDELEEIDDGPIEAIRSTGARDSQVISFGMLSQVSSSFVAWTLYILEINTRIAISLGVVGAGGIGQYINLRIDLFAFSRAAAGLIMVVFIVLSVELLSSRLRARLRPSEHEAKSIVDVLASLADPDRWLGTNARR
jgi:phosphonate transport system permease protein